jgi:hypothetical protein
MMVPRTRNWLALLAPPLMALWLLGCDLSRRAVVVQASPNPMMGQTTFAAEPLDLEGARIERPPSAPFSQSTMTALTAKQKDALNRQYLRSLTELGRGEQLIIVAASKSKPAPFTIHAEVTLIKFDCSPALKSRVTINTDSGLPVDEFEMDVPAMCPFLLPAPEELLGRLATAQAEYTVKYLARRRLER